MVRKLTDWIMLALLLAFTHVDLAGAAELEVQRVTENVYAIVGDLDQRNPGNHANNATFGLVVTDQGALLIDSGGSYQGAIQLEQAIRSVTEQPVRIVINSGGQDHRWLGNDYFKAQGARIIASRATAEDQRARTDYHYNRLTELLGEALQGTRAVYPDETFDKEMSLSLGGFEFRLIHAGPAHTLGDIFVWMPQQRVMFAGDIVFTERALGPGPAQNVKSWIEVFETMMSYQPLHIVPGHGHAGTPERARADTYDYLRFLREKVGQIIDNGGDIQDAVKLDQSRFNYLKVFDRIARRNAQAVFAQMEFE